MPRKRGAITGIVGLDPSLTSTGFARIDIEEGSVETRTIITKPNAGSIIERSRSIAMRILRLMKPGDVSFIEGYAFGIGPSTSSAFTLAELGGVLKLCLLQYTGVEPLVITTSEMRKFISGKGNIKKAVIPVWTYKMYNRECHSHDECVAMAIADMGDQIISYKPLFKMTGSVQLEIIARLRKKYLVELQSIAETFLHK